MKMTSAPRILITAYEAAPFYKKGGLGDVIGSLPLALRRIDLDARVVIPYYACVKKQYPQRKIGEMLLRFGQENRTVRIFEGTFPKTNVPVYFLENQKYFNLTTAKVRRIEEFAFFSLAVCYFASWLTQYNKWQIDLIHCNDWHTSLIPLILQKKLQSTIPTLLTIHNLLYQAKGSARLLDLLAVKDEDTLEIKRGKIATEINLLGEGIIHASAVSTVSPAYAKEITRSHSQNIIYQYIERREKKFGKSGSIVGILNGIDVNLWNPRRELEAYSVYDAHNVNAGKEKNKLFLLLQPFRLQNRPTFAFIGRMAAQKGLDVLLASLGELVRLNINLIILGEGHYAIEKAVRKASEKFSEAVRAVIAYDDNLAHKLFAGADFLLIPSHYEPCGLVQMIGMRYGTIPIASRTGGLIDTIDEGRTGFLFHPSSPKDLVRAVKQALTIYADKQRLQTMRVNCMQQDFSWDKSARRYRDLYIDILNNNSSKS